MPAEINLVVSGWEICAVVPFVDLMVSIGLLIAVYDVERHYCCSTVFAKVQTEE